MEKIVFIHLLNDYSGSPKVLSQVIKACQKNGHEVELYTGTGDDGFLSNIVDKHYFYSYKRFGDKYKYFTPISYLLSQISLFFKLLRYRKQDVIVYINTMLPFGAALAGKVMGKPVFYHIHETSIRPAYLKLLSRYVIQKTCSKVIFVSRSVLKEESFIAKRQVVIHNALPDELVKSAESGHYQWKVDSVFTVLMVCSLKVYKGINEFVEIAKQCSKVIGIQFTLVLNADQSEIDQFFAESVLTSNVLLVSRQINLVPYYRQASLLLNLSRADEWVETFGLTIIEAMAFGIPVIVPPVGGPVEIVTREREGFLISSYETEKISHKIIELSNDEVGCITLSKQAKKRSNDFRQNEFNQAILSTIND